MGLAACQVSAQHSCWQLLVLQQCCLMPHEQVGLLARCVLAKRVSQQTRCCKSCNAALAVIAHCWRQPGCYTCHS